MKLEKLHIYGFGKHEDVTIEFSLGMNVLYGLNEAGKTTIQQFILHVLFGFPQRGGALLRYEPKAGGRYGGKIMLHDEKYGKCTIERVRGKSAGDVTVYFEDSTTGGEEALRMILRQYDRTSFESIFSFSLLQLQGFEKMDEDELSRTLLASGTTGVDSLLQLEKQMEKEMGDMFKRTGRNPEMNRKMNELKQLELALKEASEKVEQYGPSIHRLQEIDVQLTSLRDEEKALKEALQQLSFYRQYAPLYRKKEELERRLNDLGEVNFPVEGRRRFDKIEDQLIDSNATRNRIKAELVDINARLQNTANEQQLQDIERLLSKEAEWHGWRSQLVTFEQRLRHLNSEQQKNFDSLGISFESNSPLFAADVSLRKEEEMHELIQEMEKIDQEIHVRESQYESVRQHLLEAEHQLHDRQAPSAEDIERARAWPEIRQRLAEAKAYVALGEHGTGQSGRLVSVGLFIIAFLLFIVGFIQQQWLVTILGVLVGGIGFYFSSKKETVHDAKFAEMKGFVETYSGKVFEMEQLIMRVESDVQSLNRLKEEIGRLRVQYEQHEMVLADLEERHRDIALKFEMFISMYGFDGMPSRGIVPELFRMIRKVQENARDIAESEMQYELIEQKVAKRVTEVEAVLDEAVPHDALYEVLRRAFMQCNEENEKVKSLTTEKVRLTEAYNEATALKDELDKKRFELLNEANVETTNEFYETDKKYEEVNRLHDQLVDVKGQLKTGGTLLFTEQRSDEDMIREMADIETKLALISENANKFMDKKATLIHKTDQLLTDETFSEQRQYFEMKKAELAVLAKKWAARTALAEAIKRVMLELKEEKLPKVLSHAEKLFGMLTDGRYEALHVTEEGYFVTVTGNGTHYPIVELSQATKEQAYISLRLSLASSLLDTAPFPIIMDDPFVHFDDERLSRMIELLRASNNHQFIYFTCHEEMKDKWTDATIINI